MSNTYTNNLALTRYLAAQIQTMTGITTYADNQTDSVEGLFSSCLLLTCVNTQEIIENNNTQRVSYSLSYITQPEQATQAAINTTLETIYQGLIGYLMTLSRYDDLGGALYLDSNIRQWAIDYEAQQSTFVLSFDIVCQM